MVPIERCNADQSQSIWDSAPTDRAISQHPGIDTVGFPHLGQFLACLLEPQLITQGFSFIPLHDLKGCKFPQLRIKPVLADFQREKLLFQRRLPLFVLALISSTTKTETGKMWHRNLA